VRVLPLVVDYRGEVLNYVGDEVIVTWPERRGAVDCRPLQCFVAMRDELALASSQLEREFGVAPRIRGSLHFGAVIVGEIGDIKRAIVFNGDVMNMAARLEELSRGVEGGFLASRVAMEQFRSALPVKVRDLGQVPIRGRMDGIDVVGLDIPAAPAACPVVACSPSTQPPLVIARDRSCPTGSSRMQPIRNLPVAPACRTRSRLRRRANHAHLFAHPAALQRAFRDRHERWLWDAMDAASRQTIVEVTYGEVVWSWRPDAGAKLAKTLSRLAGDGGKKARSPGRARRTPLKPLRREGRMIG
jgi:hypothetical protein